MGLNILFWNCQGIRQKRKELELYLKENVIDIIALNEMFLNKKLNFPISGYDTIGNDHSTGQRGGVAFLIKHSLVINKEYKNSDFNIITENEALAISTDVMFVGDFNSKLESFGCTHKNSSGPMLKNIQKTT